MGLSYLIRRRSEKKAIKLQQPAPENYEAIHKDLEEISLQAKQIRMLQNGCFSTPEKKPLWDKVKSYFTRDKGKAIELKHMPENYSPIENVIEELLRW